MEDISDEKEYLGERISKSEKKLETSFNQFKGSLNTESIIEEAVNNIGGRGDVASIIIPYLLKYRKEIFSGEWIKNVDKVFNKKTLSFFTTGLMIGAAALFYTRRKTAKTSKEK